MNSNHYINNNNEEIAYVSRHSAHCSADDTDRARKESPQRGYDEGFKEYVDEKAEEKGFGNNVLTTIGKAVVNKGIEVALNTKLKVHNYYLFNTTSVRMVGKDQLLSVGVLGMVLTFDKDMLKERLEKADPIESEQ